VPWAEPRRKVCSLGVLDCLQRGGRMALIAFIAEAKVAQWILDHLGLASTGPPVARPRAPHEAFDPPPECDGSDFSWVE
jgi:hypothetical protein